MKRLIFFVMVLCSTVYSAEKEITKEDMIWRNQISADTHGKDKAKWTEKVKKPEDCKKGEEQRLNEIVLVSLNVLNKKPDEWLQGKYLEYVNNSCDIWESLRGTSEDFDKRVDKFIKQKDSPKTETSSKVGFLFMALFVIFVGFYMIRDFLWGRRN